MDSTNKKLSTSKSKSSFSKKGEIIKTKLKVRKDSKNEYLNNKSLEALNTPDVEKRWKKDDTLYLIWMGNYKDFTIDVNGKYIQAHKAILALRSPIFNAIPDYQMEIIGFSFEIVELAMELCYNRLISSLTLEEKLSVLPFLDKYDIQDIKKSVEVSLID